MSSESTDVLVVGAGPTGLMMAVQLARRGVRPVIIDRHAGPTRETRALAVQARTLEIYSHLGIVERALELGRPGLAFNMWARGRRVARLPLGDIGRDLSPFPFALILGQDDNEKLLGEALVKLGGDVRWETELVALAQRPDGVDATVRHADGSTREIAARWVAGCDGAHSAVRTLNGIGFPGAPYEHVFFVADTRVTGPMVQEELNGYLWRKGFHLFFPMRGQDHWRVVGIVPPHLRGRDDLKFEEVVPSIRNEVGVAMSFEECTWFSTYRIHHRRAERFRDRRSFLLGDAAHIHSPVGGQGMNTGLQDAYNLAWKLALVVSGRADGRLLESYESERLPVAERLLATTDRAFVALVSDSWLAGLFRTRMLGRIMAFAMRRERVRRLAFLTISQTGIHYREGPLSRNLPGLPGNAPRAGDRFPCLKLKLAPEGAVEDLYARLDDTRFNLLVIAEPSLPLDRIEQHDFVSIHRIPSGPENDRELARSGIPTPSAYLLRPDGHVGLAGVAVDAEAVNRYLRESASLESLSGARES